MTASASSPTTVAGTANIQLAISAEAPFTPSTEDFEAGRTFYWGSSHPVPGVQFLFGNGAVRTISYDISWVKFAALLTPNGREVVTTPWIVARFGETTCVIRVMTVPGGAHAMGRYGTSFSWKRLLLQEVFLDTGRAGALLESAKSEQNAGMCAGTSFHRQLTAGVNRELAANIFGGFH